VKKQTNKHKQSNKQTNVRGVKTTKQSNLKHYSATFFEPCKYGVDLVRVAHAACWIWTLFDSDSGPAGRRFGLGIVFQIVIGRRRSLLLLFEPLAVVLPAAAAIKNSHSFGSSGKNQLETRAERGAAGWARHTKATKAKIINQ